LKTVDSSRAQQALHWIRHNKKLRSRDIEHIDSTGKT